MGSCSYPNAFSGGTTCVQYHGSAWTQDDMTAMCDGEGGASSPDACPAGDDDVDLVAAFAHSIAHGLPAPKPGVSLYPHTMGEQTYAWFGRPTRLG